MLRSFAIIAVVLYHCYCPWLDAWNWYECPCKGLYSFVLEVMLVGRMPLFVFVSGYLFSHLIIDRGKYLKFGGFVINKLKRLLIPCLLFTGIMCIVLQSNYIQSVIGAGWHLWFLKMLFLCFITAWIFNRYATNVYSRIILFILSIGLMTCRGQVEFGITQYFKYFSFFYCGYLFYAYRNQLKSIFNNTHIKNSVFLIYLVLVLVCFWRYIINDGVNDIIHSDKIVEVCRYLIRPISILIALILVDVYLKNRYKVSSVFSKLNNISYGIYLLHMLILLSLHKYFGEVFSEFATNHYIIAPVLLFVGVLIVSVLISSWLKKFEWSKWLIG